MSRVFFILALLILPTGFGCGQPENQVITGNDPEAARAMEEEVEDQEYPGEEAGGFADQNREP